MGFLSDDDIEANGSHPRTSKRARLRNSRSRARRCGGRWALTIALLLTAVPTAAQDNPAQKTRDALHTIQTAIKHAQNEQNKTKSVYNQLQDELRAAETNIGRLNRNVKDDRRQLNQLEKSLQKTEKKQRAQRRGLTEQSQHLERDILAIYTAGRTAPLRLLLSLQDPASTGRTLAYYRYISEARGARLKHINSTLAELQQTNAALERQKSRATQLSARRAQQLLDLKAQHAKREAIVANVQRELKTKENRVAILKTDEQRLQKTLASIESALLEQEIDRQRRARRLDAIQFAQLKGQLPWPTQGPLQAKFGGIRSAGNIRWRGVLIGAKHGQAVSAIAPGRVVFADWLKGFGLLLIIDHNDGFLSLYGHNDTLLKNTDEIVDQNEVIAYVGRSGGQQQSSLYFELRRSGKPINPLHWLAARH